MSDDKNGFGHFLKQLRVRSGFKTQKQLAEISGVSQTTLSRIEAGSQRPMPETLKMLAFHLRPYTYGELMEKAGYFERLSSGDPFSTAEYDDHHEPDAQEHQAHPSRSQEITTIAAHHEGEDWTEEELAELERFKQFIKSKRK